ncbi:stalk domain-containing protein [Gorillibacterium sp. sgz5001074]|uniref:stalk domain-containing protein n=1 Tax=Gorillibacterium sp. sgz5001074 TaxID=3446695 RepID=UPI003F67A13D
MKRFAAGVLCGVLLTAATAVYATDVAESYLYPAKYVFNGKAKEIGDGYVTLNYGDHAYVPVRFVAESMGALVKFDEATTTITVQDTNLSRKLQLDAGFLPAAASGKLQGIPYGIGAAKDAVHREYGEPHKTGNWHNFGYEAWFDYDYFFHNPDGSVSSIVITGDSARFSIDDVKTAIGLPLYEGTDEMGEVPWYLCYEAGEYQLFFAASGKGGFIDYVLYKKK